MIIIVIMMLIGDDDSDSGDDGVAVQDEMAPIYLRSATFIHRQGTIFLESTPKL